MAEFFQNVWSLLTTENAELVNLLILPLSFIEALVSVLFFTTILKIKSSKKQIIAFVFSLSIAAIIINLLVPNPYCNYLNIIVMPVLVLIIFRTSLLKAIVAQISQYLVFVLSASLLSTFYTLIFGLTTQQIKTILIYRISFSLIQYVLIFLLYFYSKKNNLNIDLLDNMNKKTNIALLVNFLIGIVAIGLQSFIITELTTYMPIGVNIASLAILIIYFISNLYNLSRTAKLEKTEQDLEEEKAYNKTITVMYDNIRAFRHDFNNIVQAIGRFYCHRRYQRS